MRRIAWVLWAVAEELSLWLGASTLLVIKAEAERRRRLLRLRASTLLVVKAEAERGRRLLRLRAQAHRQKAEFAPDEMGIVDEMRGRRSATFRRRTYARSLRCLLR